MSKSYFQQNYLILTIKMSLKPYFENYRKKHFSKNMVLKFYKIVLGNLGSTVVFPLYLFQQIQIKIKLKKILELNWQAQSKPVNLVETPCTSFGHRTNQNEHFQPCFTFNVIQIVAPLFVKINYGVFWHQFFCFPNLTSLLLKALRGKPSS